MNLSAEKFTIHLPKPFRIAHGISYQRDTILVRLLDPESGLMGCGEGALPPYYPSTAEACLAWLESLSGSFSADQARHPQNNLGDPNCILSRNLSAYLSLPPTASAAMAALDIALHDLHAQRVGVPLWRQWRLDPACIPPCARTLSIPQSEAELREGLRDGWSRGSRHFKLKSGSGDLAWDEQCVHLAVAEFPGISLSLDVNAGWSAPDAAAVLARLTDVPLEYVEQPVPADWSAWAELSALLAGKVVTPLVADESMQSLADLASAHLYAQGVNVKLLKAGGLTGARAWIQGAHEAGLRVLLGCMVETGIGRTATAHLAPLADWLDIDPPDSIPFAPAVGFSQEGDRLTLSDRPGLGLRGVE